MKIVVIGNGSVGDALVGAICNEGHNVTVIDEDASIVNAVVNKDGESDESFESVGEIDIAKISYLPKEAVNGALAKLGAGYVSSGKYDVVFSGTQFRAFLSAFASVFSAKQAQLGLSLLAGKAGEQIAASCVTITDDPMRDGSSMKALVGREARSEYELLLEDRGDSVPCPEFGISLVVIERMSYLGMKVQVALTGYHNYCCCCCCCY